MKAKGKVDENTTATKIRGLKRIRKIGEEDEAEGLLEDVQERMKQQEDEKWKELEEYIASWDTEKRRTSSLSTKIWQVTEGDATKAESLENDFTEATSEAEELGWSEGKSNPKCWFERTDDSDS